jgi:hypothetical protein
VFSEFNYIHRGKTMRQQAATHLGYIGERPGKDKAEIVRTLFGKGGPYTREQVVKMIGEAPDNTLFWRLKLNPDPILENPEKILNLETATREAFHLSLLSMMITRNLPMSTRSCSLSATVGKNRLMSQLSIRSEIMSRSKRC